VEEEEEEEEEMSGPDVSRAFYTLDVSRVPIINGPLRLCSIHCETAVTKHFGISPLTSS